MTTTVMFTKIFIKIFSVYDKIIVTTNGTEEFALSRFYKNKDEIFNCYSALVYKGTDVMGGYDAYLKDGKIYNNDNTEF